MRISMVVLVAAFAAASAARADDTKPPQISDVKAAARGGQVHVEARITDETGVLSAICHHRSPGGKVEDSPMVKNDFDDVFKTSFAGGGDSEYWIEASDLLGNGPSTWGSAAKAVAVAKSQPPKTVATNQEPKPDAQPKQRREPRRTTKSAEPPAIEYRKPSAQPPEGRDYTVQLRIKSESPVEVAILRMRPKGSPSFNNTPLTHTSGDNYEARIPAGQARGTVEYLIAAKNQAGQMATQGDGDAKTPYALTFRGAAQAAPAVALSDKPSGPYVFTNNPLVRVMPGRGIVVRAQVVPTADDGQMPDRVAVLWRGNDAQDQLTDMVRDETGGWGGVKAELPAQDEGAIFYQIVACDAGATRCGIDTGSKRKWHAASVSSQPASAPPMALDAVSNKAPPTLPE
ncbi:MAG TPA: hypothetical protein VFE90_07675 [Myxococcales bacterium]|jgi:hypothetical protein|nr:hypothetical protein [Myxococcales bacterium]